MSYFFVSLLQKNCASDSVWVYDDNHMFQSLVSIVGVACFFSRGLLPVCKWQQRAVHRTVPVLLPFAEVVAFIGACHDLDGDSGSEEVVAFFAHVVSR